MAGRISSSVSGAYDWGKSPYIIAPNGIEIYTNWTSWCQSAKVRDNSLMILNEYCWTHSYYNQVGEDVVFVVDLKEDGFSKLHAIRISRVELGRRSTTKFMLGDTIQNFTRIDEGESYLLRRTNSSDDPRNYRIRVDGGNVSVEGFNSTFLNPHCFYIAEGSNGWRIFVRDAMSTRYISFLVSKADPKYIWWTGIPLLFDGQSGSTSSTMSIDRKGESNIRNMMNRHNRRVEEEKWLTSEPEEDYKCFKLTPDHPIILDPTKDRFSFFFTSDIHVQEPNSGFWKNTRTQSFDVFNLIHDNLIESDRCVVYGGDFVHSTRDRGVQRWELLIDLFRKSRMCGNNNNNSDDRKNNIIEPIVPQFLVIGNHDCDPDRKMYDKFIGASFGHARFHRDDQKILMMIFLDTSWGMIGRKQFEETEKLLAEEERYEYVILVTHYSFVYDVNKSFAFRDVEDRNKFERMLNRYRVDLVLSGHTHQYLSGFGHEYNDHNSSTTFHMTHGLFPRDLTAFRVHVDSKEGLVIEYFTLGYQNDKNNPVKAEVFQTIRLKKKEKENLKENLL